MTMRFARILLIIVFCLGILQTASAAEPDAADSAKCVESGGTWDTDNMRPNGHCIADTPSKCAVRGGAWQRVCLAQGLSCVTPTKDGGKACTDGSQCQLGCEDQGNPPRKDGTLVGACRRDDNPCGAFRYLSNGKRAGILNVD
jgi:hypothetical protein